MKKRFFMLLFHGCGSTTSRLEPLLGGSLLFTIKLAEIAGTNFLSTSEGRTAQTPKSDSKKGILVLM